MPAGVRPAVFWRAYPFGQDDDKWKLILNQEVNHHQVILGRRVTHVYQLENQADSAITVKVSFNQVRPALFFSVGNLCISIAWKVCKADIFQFKKVDGCGFSRNCADACQRFSVKDFVDQTGFADVGTAGKSNLDKIRLGQLTCLTKDVSKTTL